MSEFVFFAFSASLKSSLHAPKGTLAKIFEHVAWIEDKLEIEVEEYRGEKRWKSPSPSGSHLTDYDFCNIVWKHNTWVRWLYEQMVEWSKNPVVDGDEITPDHAKEFWRVLTMLNVEVGRWSPEHYREQMDVIYDVMRGIETNGIKFDAPGLTPEQAGAVITLFSFLDPEDQRLEVCKNHDSLDCGDDYEWCEKCGAVHLDDVEHYMRTCEHPGDECPLRRNCAGFYPGYDDEQEEEVPPPRLACQCRCPDGPCEHVWDGPEAQSDDGLMSTATCSRCGMWAINHDILMLP